MAGTELNCWINKDKDVGYDVEDWPASGHPLCVRRPMQHLG